MIICVWMIKYSVRVSNELGAAHPKSASFSVVAVTTLSFLVALVFAVLVLIFRYQLSYIFTGGAQVSEAVADLSPFLAISILLNGIQPVLSGIYSFFFSNAFVARENLYEENPITEIVSWKCAYNSPITIWFWEKVNPIKYVCKLVSCR